jgi:hypothetical protein
MRLYDVVGSIVEWRFHAVAMAMLSRAVGARFRMSL